MVELDTNGFGLEENDSDTDNMMGDANAAAHDMDDLTDVSAPANGDYGPRSTSPSQKDELRPSPKK